MNVHLIVMLLGLHISKTKDLGPFPAPQVTCPLNLDEYSLQFRWWARKEVKERQWLMAIERQRQLIKGQI